MVNKAIPSPSKYSIIDLKSSNRIRKPIIYDEGDVSASEAPVTGLSTALHTQSLRLLIKL